MTYATNSAKRGLQRFELLVAILSVAVLAACAPATRVVEASKPERPVWLTKAPKNSGSDRLYVGMAVARAAEPDVRKLAIANALAEAARELQAETTSSLSIMESESAAGGADFTIRSTTDIATAPVRLRGTRVVDEYSERWAVESGWETRGWVVVAVPVAQLRRAERLLSGLTAWRVTCEPVGLCSPALLAKIQGVATQARVGTGRLRLTSAPLTGSIEESETAQLLDIRVEVAGETVSGDEHYVRTRAHWKLTLRETGCVLDSVETGPVKGGHYTREKAAAMSLDALVKELGNLTASRDVRLDTCM